MVANVQQVEQIPDAGVPPSVRDAWRVTELVLHVINLPRSTGRRASMQAQAAALGLSLTFFEAVDGHASHPLFAHVHAGKRQARKGRPFRPGELGCWASHYLLWQQCVANGKPMIVLEDDIMLDSRFPELLRVLPLVPANVGYFRLHAENRASVAWQQFGSFVLHRYWDNPSCTFGYYLAPLAAERFLRHAAEWVVPVDDYMDLAWLHGVECLGLKPGVVSGGDVFDSTIRAYDKKKAAVGVKGWMTREAHRAWLDLRWFQYNLFARLRLRLHS